MKILVIGANGQIGHMVVNKLKHDTNGSVPVAMVRKAEQLDQFTRRDIEVRMGDLEENFEEAYEGINAVVFAAGSGADTGEDKTVEIDQKGAMKAIDAAAQHNVDRFVMISAYGADHNPDEWPEAMAHYYRAKRAADEYLRQSNLNFTILHPAMLTDDQPTGKIKIDGITEEDEMKITRNDVADVVVKCLHMDATDRTIIDLINGDTMIEEALQQLETA